MVVAGAGAVDHAQLVQLAQNAFGNLPSSAPASATALEPVNFIGSDVRIKNDEMPLAHVAIAFEGFSWTSEHAFPMLVMQTLLGQWDRTSGAGMNMSSKLGQVVAEKELAHSFMAFNTCYQDTGLFGVYAVADQYKLNDLTWYTMEALVRLVHKTSDEEVERAKTQLKANMLMQLDGTSPICEDIGRQLLTYGRRLTPAEIFARIDAVDAAAVRNTADEVINDKEHALAALGPIYELPDYNFIRRRSYWTRY
jgi:mitochondrial-processing peptidase subunit beta